MRIEALITYVSDEATGINSQAKSWRRRDYVAEYEAGQYPKGFAFSVFNDSIDRLNLQYGARYALTVDLTTRSYNGRYFTDIRCADAEWLGGTDPAPRTATETPVKAQSEPEDLPF